MTKIFAKALIFLVNGLLITGCAITHQYGPYMGKVVDKETNEPLEGAVVFLQFYAYWPNPVDAGTMFVDALETLTDKNGKFSIPTYRAWSFKPYTIGWDLTPNVIIFKPGYGAFGGHKDSRISKWKRYGEHNNGISDDEPFTVFLPKLKTREERKENLDHTFVDLSVPFLTRRILFELRNIESELIGLTPWPIPR